MVSNGLLDNNNNKEKKRKEKKNEQTFNGTNKWMNERKRMKTKEELGSDAKSTEKKLLI